MRLLLVEDEQSLAAALRRDLTAAGFAVDWVADGLDAQVLGAESSFDVVVLDLGLPGQSGLAAVSAWRQIGVTTPVLVLTARDAWHERVDGLKAGADDYLGKPFHTEELIARLNALIRRAAGHAGGGLVVAGLHLDEDRQRALLPDGQLVELTATEFRLLRYFMLNPNKLLSKTRLLDHCYDDSADHDGNTIEVYVRRLRDKLGKHWILTQRGQGYRFQGDP